MDSMTLLANARAAGLSIRRAGSQLVINGPKRLAPFALELLARKADILAALGAENPKDPSAHQQVGAPQAFEPDTLTDSARYVFDERMGIAAEQGMSLRPDGLAWRTAQREALADAAPSDTPVRPPSRYGSGDDFIRLLQAAANASGLACRLVWCEPRPRGASLPTLASRIDAESRGGACVQNP